jgi:crotonobetainyl-CoA:carnitine CoA-transferase CaiB-like acyl-CoA transferase
LHGVRVLDLSRVFAGPLCGQVLADFGAEVIKVEHPGRGDDTRDWGIRIGKTETTYYNGMNRNKRSITLDLQSPRACASCSTCCRSSTWSSTTSRPVAPKSWAWATNSSRPSSPT